MLGPATVSPCPRPLPARGCEISILVLAERTAVAHRAGVGEPVRPHTSGLRRVAPRRLDLAATRDRSADARQKLVSQVDDPTQEDSKYKGAACFAPMGNAVVRDESLRLSPSHPAAGDVLVTRGGRLHL